MKFLISAVVLAFYGLFMTALITKYREVKRARLWIATPGKIISCRSEARRIRRNTSGSVRGSIEDTEIRNFAAVRYQFKVGGRQITGDRISIGDDLGNVRVAETLQRYPVGTEVTVFHDPCKPETCVIERDVPGRTFEIAILTASLIGLCILTIVFAINGLFARLGQIGMDRSPAVAFLVVMGVLTIAFAFMLHKRGRATHAWATTMGTIISSTVDRVKVRSSLGSSKHWQMRTLFRSRTIYTYRIDGIDFKSDRVSYGAQLYASFRLFAKRDAATFAEGQPVEVHYDPAAPEQAVLVRGAPGEVLVWLIGLVLLAMAIFITGII